MGDNLVVVRDRQRALHGFHNVCRTAPRASSTGRAAIAAMPSSAPYHAWGYSFDGKLVSVPFKENFPDFDLDRHGLVPLEVETFLGFIFVRQRPGGPQRRRDDGALSRRARALSPAGIDLARRVTPRSAG